MGNRQTVLDTVIEMNIKSKQLARLSQKCSQEVQQERLKVKRSIQKGDVDSARIFAENAIRKESDALTYLHMSSKLEAMASRLKSANESQEMTKDIQKAVPGLSKCLKKLNMRTLTKNLAEFESIFGNIDAASALVSTTLEHQVASKTPADRVNQLISQVADEYALDLGDKFQTSVPSQLLQNPAESEKASTVSIADRLSKL